MIKFFRKIRQSLVEENRLANYYLNALREIVLVGHRNRHLSTKAGRVGFQPTDYVAEASGPEILAALLVDNWQLIKNTKYYRQFQDDLVFFVAMSE